MRQLADFVTRMMVETPTTAGPDRGGRSRASGPAGPSGSSASRATGATRTSASTGPIAATAFDEIIVREDKNLRGRAARRDRRRTSSTASARPRPRARLGRHARRRSSRRCRPSGPRSAGPSRATSSCAASMTRSASTARRRRRPGTSRGGTAFADPGELDRPGRLIRRLPAGRRGARRRAACRGPRSLSVNVGTPKRRLPVLAALSAGPRSLSVNARRRGRAVTTGSMASPCIRSPWVNGSPHRAASPRLPPHRAAPPGTPPHRAASLRLRRVRAQPIRSRRCIVLLMSSVFAGGDQDATP